MATAVESDSGTVCYRGTLTQFPFRYREKAKGIESLGTKEYQRVPMNQNLNSTSDVSLTVSNIGGIETAALVLQEGVTVFYGENASNRSSLFSAVAGVLGARTPKVKTDAEEGAVGLEFRDDHYAIEVDSSGRLVNDEGEPLTDQQVLCDHFVRLLEDNPLRESVERVDEADLYDQLMQPVDTEEIEAEIDRLTTERQQIEDRLARYRDLEEQRTQILTNRSTVQKKLESVETELASKRETLAELEDERNESRHDDLLQTLESKRSEYRTVTTNLESQREALERLESEYDSVVTDLDEQTGDDGTTDLDTLDEQIAARRSRKRQIGDTIQLLQTIIEASRNAVDEPASISIGHADETEHVTDALAPSATEVECLMCGSAVTTDVIDEQRDELQSIVADKRSEQKELADEITDLEGKRTQIQEKRQQIETQQQRKRQLEREITDTEATIEALKTDKEELEETITDLEQTAAEIESTDDSDYLEAHKAVTELEFEREQLEDQLDSLDEKLAEIESEIEDKAAQQDRLDELEENLETLRNRIYEIERETVEMINSMMDDVISQLAFDNLERVWIERRVSETQNPKGQADGFALHVVRTTEEKVAYEDTIETLSTSEREVIGIVLGVAGYLAHDVSETVPFLLLDAIESIDAERTYRLLSYLSNHTEYLLATAHPEDKNDAPDEFHQIEIEHVLE